MSAITCWESMIPCGYADLRGRRAIIPVAIKAIYVEILMARSSFCYPDSSSPIAAGYSLKSCGSQRKDQNLCP